MMDKSFRLTKAMVISVISALLLVGVAYATTIIIDGADDPWPAGSQQGLDRNEDGVPDGEPVISDNADISYVYFTNSATVAYWRYDTYSPTNYETGFSDPYVYICLDTVPGGTTSFQCDNLSGVIDYQLLIQGNNNNPIVTYLDCTSGSCTVSTASDLNVGWVSSPAGTITEVSVAISDIGFPGPCTFAAPCEYQYEIYFDNQTTNPDDQFPDEGTITGQFPEDPTAITLASLTARSGNLYAVPLLVGSLLLLAALLLVVRRARTRVN
jgi:hypothetical protein